MEKLRALKNARFASATTCSFGINPRSSLRLAFWRYSPEPSHRDFSSLSDPPALTAPHCVQKKHVLVAVFIYEQAGHPELFLVPDTDVRGLGNYF